MSESLKLWLSQELNQRNWSHRELARQTGITQSFISNVIAGKKPPSVNFCRQIAQALEVSPELVLRLAGILPPAEPATATDDPVLQELVELARHLPDEQRKELLRYTRYLYQTSQSDNL